MRTFILSSASGRPQKVFNIPEDKIDETDYWDLRADVWRIYHYNLHEIPSQECQSLDDLRKYIDETNGKTNE